LEIYPVAQQIVKHINTLTELGDKISVLKTAIDNDGRIRTSYNIGGTSTGRFSSSLSDFGTGGNLQNIEESLRSIFIADPGYKFCKCDAKSGESFCVGAIEWNLFHDARFLDACESGDPHTAVARIMWPDLPWTGSLARDKEVAESIFYRHYTYRFMCKKLGHGSNYGGKPQTLAEQTKVDLDLVRDFQPKYFANFPSHQLWQAHVEETLRRQGFLVSLTGRKRYFFGRRSDPDVLRQAIAYDPQCSLADIVNQAMMKIWRMNLCPIMLHDHDALTFMYPEAEEDRIVPILLENLVVPVPLAQGRVLRIPYDCEVGWNKGQYNAKKNPNGLKPYRGQDSRTREATPGILDRILHRANLKSELT
jgi:DNA polymerase-1